MEQDRPLNDAPKETNTNASDPESFECPPGEEVHSRSSSGSVNSQPAACALERTDNSEARKSPGRFSRVSEFALRARDRQQRKYSSGLRLSDSINSTHGAIPTKQDAVATPVVTTCANDAIAAPTNRQASGGEQDCSSDARTSALSSVHEYPHSNLRKKRTKNGIPWLDVHRGLIIAAQDRGRPYRGVPPDPGDTDTFELDDAVYLNKNRCWVVDRRFPDHVQALPIYTHTGGGLKALSKDLQFESMCIRPFSGVANWTNEVPWNEVLEIKTRHSGIILSASASVRVSQSILIDRWEDYEIIAELDDASMDKIKAKQEQLDKLAG